MSRCSRVGPGQIDAIEDARHHAGLLGHEDGKKIALVGANHVENELLRLFGGSSSWQVTQMPRDGGQATCHDGMSPGSERATVTLSSRDGGVDTSCPPVMSR
jgi:hypothetical protein